MSIDVIPLTDEHRDDWQRCVEQSPQANPFHQLEALSVVARHADATLHPLLGLNGAEPVGVFPVFECEAGGTSRFRPRDDVSVVRSPPHLLESFSLGPALANLEKMKPRKRERYRAEFLEASLDLIQRRLGPDELHVRTDARFDDARPFRWHGLDAVPYYTYEVDLTRDPDEIMAGFSRDARSNVRSTESARHEIREGDAADAAFVIEQVNDRYAEQGEPYRLTTAFVRELYEQLPEGQLRPYVCDVDGERVSGILALEFGDRIYRWQGGVRTSVDVPTSDLLDWHVMRTAAERDVAAYDLVGANKRRLCDYKSKFGPDLREYYNVYGKNGVSAAVSDVRSAVEELNAALPVETPSLDGIGGLGDLGRLGGATQGTEEPGNG